MSRQSGWPVESLVAAFPGTFDGLQFGWELLSGRRKRSGRRVRSLVLIGGVRIALLVSILHVIDNQFLRIFVGFA
jgi:hypothetical protein